MQAHDLTDRAPRKQDVAALIGVLAALEGELITDDRELPGWVARLASRLSSDGLLDGHSNRDVRQTLHDLNQRLRYVLGEYDDPPDPLPVS
jgi:hypothetical protein